MNVKPPLDKELNTPLFKHIKNEHRVQKVADFLRQMYRWGFFDDVSFERQINRLQYSLFVIENDPDAFKQK